MKHRIKTLLCCLMISQMFLMNAYAKPVWPADTGIQAEAGIVIDADTGTVLFGQNIHVEYFPASITKLLTALIVLENSGLSDTVTFSKDAVYNVEEGSGNKLNIAEGDTLSVEDCLSSLILHSCNQAANALAEHVAGSREEFVRMMNEKIAELGCKESHFDNPSGLNGDTQYVTAYDMALIAKAAYENQKLVEISSQLSYNIPPTSQNPDGLTIYNEHRLVKTSDPESEFYYPPAVAGKTGYLIKSGNTVVTYAEKDGRREISVILKGSPRQYFVDCKTLLEFGFNRFENLSIEENEKGYTEGESPVEIGGVSYQPSDLSLEAGAVITLPKGAIFSDAEKALLGDGLEGAPAGAVGLIKYTYDERKVGQAYLISKSAAEVGGTGPVGEPGQGGTPTGDGESEPGNSGEPGKKGEPENSGEPEKKGEPENSGEPEKKGEPENSGEPGKIGEPENSGKKEEPESGKEKGIFFAGAVFFAAVIGGGAGWFVYSKKKEAKELAKRREERRKRLMQEGEAENFERILQERRQYKKKI